ncbi:SMI1/KNR4 family protein [Streptomyces sp. NPDC049813]|uniref:SMI1/KNR4 family protein n=1 Tax=Streptomyces sp. NPDC049813 TaxID=3365597 RepID=UPI0037945649
MPTFLTGHQVMGAADMRLSPRTASEVYQRQLNFRTEDDEDTLSDRTARAPWEPTWIPFCSLTPQDTACGLYLNGETGEVWQWTEFAGREREYASLPAYLELMAISLEAPVTGAGPEKPGMLDGALVWGPPSDAECRGQWMSHRGQESPRHPDKTLGAIRTALPADARDQFDEQRDALVLTDPEAAAAFLDQWWSRAVQAQQELEDEVAAALGGNVLARPGRTLAPEYEATLPPAIRHRPPSLDDIRAALRHEGVRARFNRDLMDAIPPHYPALLLRWWDLARLMADPRGDRAVRAVIAGRDGAS